ncbi:transcriptional regulator, HxlR family [Roseovarius pacificus]|uniref:Transcriptional regulator, HxlR family n=1 Tax=Roseovarius pacificus TaxID=337701 RepID=A0A1M7JEN5_9RHOB|nr:helix-turn-helix domain-containing protein [Roseovarius pacificus]GGO61896.1 transcriptional regulator [Roseovarius pacificus]SHM51283.1 transcriptional regulator, HxlR family [Roseovarius pacificus]
MSVSNHVQQEFSRPRELERNCSVRGTVELVIDSWSFLIIREAFFGIRRFDRFQQRLGIPRQTLTNRLNALIENEILVVGKKEGEAGRQYFFTERGKDLFQIMLSLMEFGDRWLSGDAKPPLQMIHTTCGAEMHPMTVCSECLEPVETHTVHFRDGPGAGYSPVSERPRTRRSSDPKVLERVRPCSVARSLQIIGDKWSFLVLREAYFGVRRYDEMREKLGIASNVLADRLARLVDAGVFDRVPYGSGSRRCEYRFTDMGRALYKPMIVMMAWGDRWLNPDAAPLRLRHRTCGNDFTPQVVCSECKEPLKANETDYFLRYDLSVP